MKLVICVIVIQMKIFFFDFDYLERKKNSFLKRINIDYFKYFKFIRQLN
jgi:hypothetical protein